MNGKGTVVAFFAVVVLVLVGVMVLAHVNEGTKAQDVRAGIRFMHGKISLAQPSQTFQAALAADEVSRHSGSFRIGADFEGFRTAEALWSQARTLPADDAGRTEVEGFFTQTQDQLKQDLLANQFTAATLGEILGEPNLWDRLNRDPR